MCCSRAFLEWIILHINKAKNQPKMFPTYFCTLIDLFIEYLINCVIIRLFMFFSAEVMLKFRLLHILPSKAFYLTCKVATIIIFLILSICLLLLCFILFLCAATVTQFPHGDHSVIF